MIVLWIVLGVLILFLAVLLVRTLRFTPPVLPAPAPLEEHPDADKAIRHMQQLIRCRTVSNRDKALEEEAEFDKLYALLPELFPNVHRVCDASSPVTAASSSSGRAKARRSPAC